MRALACVVILAFAVPAAAQTSGKAADRFLPLVAEDAQAATALVGKWRPRLDEIGSERHRKMVNLMLGETLEQQRVFEHIDRKSVV